MSIQSVTSTTPGSVVAPRQSTPQSTAQSTAQSAHATPDAHLAKPATATQEATPPAKAAPANEEQLNQAVKAVNDFVKLSNNSLQFSVDKDSGKTVVKVIDIATKEVIKQFPSEEMLAIAKALDGIKGLLVHQKA
jgi:flagellar protein FlaG